MCPYTHVVYSLSLLFQSLSYGVVGVLSLTYDISGERKDREESSSQAEERVELLCNDQVQPQSGGSGSMFLYISRIRIHIHVSWGETADFDLAALNKGKHFTIWSSLQSHGSRSVMICFESTLFFAANSEPFFSNYSDYPDTQHRIEEAIHLDFWLF